MIIDYSTVFTGVLSTIWYFIPFIILAVLLKSPWFKGVFGEAQVNLAAKFFLNKEDYHLIKNVTLPTEEGSTQIDHIIVSKYGIFVIETKNMKGWIFGGEHQKTWTQKIYKHTTKFQNPIHQNYKHVKTLESCLMLPESRFFSVVVFVGESTFKTDMPDNVTYTGGYLRYIKSKKQILLSSEEVKYSHDMIQYQRLRPSLSTNRDHVSMLQANAAKEKSCDLCSRCGKDLVLRVAKKGPNQGKEFMGCTGFPKCRFVRDL
jgi:hypothetical protein